MSKKSNVRAKSFGRKFLRVKLNPLVTFQFVMLIKFPTTNATLEYRKSLYPGNIQSFLDGEDMRVNYEELVVSTTSEIVQQAAPNMKFGAKSVSTLKIVMKN